MLKHSRFAHCGEQQAACGGELRGLCAYCDGKPAPAVDAERQARLEELLRAAREYREAHAYTVIEQNWDFLRRCDCTACRAFAAALDALEGK